MFVSKMKTILIIDDSPEVLENTAELLELEGYKVITAKNGVDGFMQTRKHIPDAVLCDLMMPELDGYGYFNLIKTNKSTSRIPVVFFSAVIDPRLEKTDKHTFGFLSKPFTDVALIAAIGSCFV